MRPQVLYIDGEPEAYIRVEHVIWCEREGNCVTFYMSEGGVFEHKCDSVEAAKAAMNEFGNLLSGDVQ